ncbi:UDP-N-acetylglucosamine 2-epimerase (hydrolyzing) [Carboxylicivirga sediminis]|uniref:UDP-N-acetylglucosamine 2-epimerase (Hydrolyzing) n=1 Tax=Carboxylicivirga sediminis TaxID=2006564 RepID=A0A941J0G2_9BACT|nr:UDP-N-acetylglucosamine 2-epimerase [Carboxylicivirga sediminis]MBR8537387.1 UDP-N-acetylglucosamine 2-epimerase (hydrolyzing) [Carboxylicivirga sediminis]
MKIGVLTSSRADFGVLYPLIKRLDDDPLFDVNIIAFGTHLSKMHGYTLSEIESYGFNVPHKITTCVDNETPSDIAFTLGDTTVKFSSFWKKNSFDLVFALGDRYEMYAAVSAASPFGIDIAHIHAGETTLGAIDNAYRHAISLMSKYHFVSTKEYFQRACEITKCEENVFNVGALSVDNLKKQRLYSIEEFKDRFEIDLDEPTILSTFHPETVAYDKNESFIQELLEAFDILREKFQVVITMPNSDTMGNMVRRYINEFAKGRSNVFVVESFGMIGYLSCMKHCSMMIGNTSSGFVEASFFPTRVINLGSRQDGRINTPNIVTIPIEKKIIIDSANSIMNKHFDSPCCIYGEGETSEKITQIIKNVYGLR